ncbi:MAG: hypothetical protein FWD16_02515 [Clostridia bacterium]|nr:hypothetical protein [Clostridia bacterium]
MKHYVWPGADPATATLRFEDFSHGLDQSAADSLLPNGAALNTNHCEINSRSLRNSTGIAKAHTNQLPAPVESLMCHYEGTTPKIMAVCSNGTLWSLDNNTASIVWSDISGKPVCHLNYQKNSRDVLIFGSPQDGFLTYDAGLISRYPNCPDPRALALHKERLWALPADDPMAVVCSRDMAPTDWTQTLNTGALIRILTWDGTRCTGLKAVFDDIIVAKERSLWRIWGSDPENFQLSPIYSGHGAISNRSMAVCEGGMAFLSTEGVYFYDGVRSRPLNSHRIDKLIKNVMPQYAERAVGFYHNSRYYLSIPSGAARNNMLLIYDFTIGAWTTRQDLHINDWLLVGNKLYCAMEDGFVALYGESNTILGFPMVCTWNPPSRGLDTLPAAKELKRLSVTARGEGTVQFTLYMDRQTPVIVNVRLTDVWQTQHFKISGRGAYMHMRMKTAPGTKFEIAGMAVELALHPD